MPPTNLLRLDSRREITFGSPAALAAAASRGADLRLYTTFDYAEHMAAPDNPQGLIQELMDFGVVYVLGDHVAAIQTTRYPANCSLGFVDLPSISFFLCNADGNHGIARPFLDGRTGGTKQVGYTSPKYFVQDFADPGTTHPSENFTYDFGEYAWWADDPWGELLAHEADGTVTRGSIDELQEAARAGMAMKVGIRNLCSYLAPDPEAAPPHEVFVEMGPIYSHQDAGFLGGETQPVVRVAPDVPFRYASGNWDFGWLLPRTDGIVFHLIVDPKTRTFTQRESRHTIRWFAR